MVRTWQSQDLKLDQSDFEACALRIHEYCQSCAIPQGTWSHRGLGSLSISAPSPPPHILTLPIFPFPNFPCILSQVGASHEHWLCVRLVTPSDAGKD